MLKKLVLSCFCLLMGFGILLADNADNDKDEVAKRLQEFTQIFNKGETQDLASFLTEDAEFINPLTGEAIDGREAVMKYLQNQSQQSPGKKLVFKESKIEFPNPNQAVVQGLVQIIDQGKVVEQRARRIELVKQNNEWVLDVIKNIDIEAPPELFEHLKDLSFLIGNWKDEDEDVTIRFSAHWDKYKNFIVQHFNVVVYGIEELEGIQIIGWDPIEKKIRSWIFDSDGGFGTAVWSKEENSWYAALTYTLSDGRKASSTNIYTPVDENRYTYSSIGRDVSGEVLSNIDPVTVVKEK